MKLRDWLIKKGIKQSEFAEDVNVGRAHLNSVINGNRNSGRKLAKSIEKETNGEITFDNVMSGMSLGYEGKSRRVSANPKVIIQKELPNNCFSLL